MKDITFEQLEFEAEYSFDPVMAPDLSPQAVARAAYAGYQCALARNAAADAKSKYKRLESELYIQTIDHHQATGQKATIDYIKAKISVHPELLKAEREYLDAEAAHQVLKAEYEALTDRSMTLKVLTSYQKKNHDGGLE